MMRIDPAIGLLISLGVALLFARAVAHKLRDLPQLRETFAAYDVLPAAAPVAWLLPVLELGIAVGLLLPVCRVYAAGAALPLLLIYASAITLNLWRGRSDLSCGCGGPSERARIAPWMVIRNLVIAAATAATLLPWQSRELVFTDAVTVSFGLATLALVYQILEQLMIQAEHTLQQGVRR
jgi:uncharacterized membrane protein YphA (DoxX/SURF4 family)